MNSSSFPEAFLQPGAASSASLRRPWQRTSGQPPIHLQRITGRPGIVNAGRSTVNRCAALGGLAILPDQPCHRGTPSLAPRRPDVFPGSGFSSSGTLTSCNGFGCTPPPWILPPGLRPRRRSQKELNLRPGARRSRDRLVGGTLSSHARASKIPLLRIPSQLVIPTDAGTGPAEIGFCISFPG